MAPDPQTAVADSDVKKFVNAYLVCAIWSSTLDDGEPVDSVYGVSDFSADALSTAEANCRAFIAVSGSALSDAIRPLVYSWASAGHDFWLTHCGHGSGFWDRDVLAGSPGRALTLLARKFRESTVYVGGDGKLHLAGGSAKA